MYERTFPLIEKKKKNQRESVEGNEKELELSAVKKMN